MERISPVERMLVHDRSVTDATARLYDVPVDLPTYEWLETLRLPEHVEDPTSLSSGLAVLPRCASQMDMVRLSYNDDGTKAYLSSDPQEQAARRQRVVLAMGGGSSRTPLTQATHTNSHLSRDVSEPMRVFLEGAIQNFRAALVRVLQAPNIDWRKDLEGRRERFFSLEPGCLSLGTFPPGSIVFPDAVWQDNDLKDPRYWVQRWLVSVRQSLSTAFQRQVNFHLRDLKFGREFDAPDLDQFRFRVVTQEELVGRPMVLSVERK